MAKSAFVGIGITEWQLNPLDINPDISEDIQQVIAYLSAYNEPNNVLKVLRADADGRLLVSTGAAKLSQYNRQTLSPGVTATQILAANTNRRYYSIYNVGGRILFIGDSSTVTASSGIALPPHNIFTDDTHIGAVWMISASGTGKVYVSEY